MYQPRVFFSPLAGKVLDIFWQKFTGRGFFLLGRYIWVILDKNVPVGNFSFTASTFWPFVVKMYHLGNFFSQPVHFGRSERKRTSCRFFFLSRYISAILGENVPTRGFLFSAGTFWTFWAKTYRPGFFSSRRLYLCHFGRKCTSREIFVLSRYSLAILGENPSSMVLILKGPQKILGQIIFFRCGDQPVCTDRAYF